MKRNLRYAILLAGACVIAFAGALDYPFLQYDDWAYVTGNPNLVLDWPHFWRMIITPVQKLATPLPQASFFLDYAIGGLQVRIYHLINLLWHIGVVYLACRLFRELGISRRTAFFLALVFAVHPQRVESVVWIAERKDVMCAFFFLLACVLQQKALRHRKNFSPGSVAAMTAAVLCKPYAVCLPLVLAALDFHRTHRFRFRPVQPHLITSGLLLILFCTTVQKAGSNITQIGLFPVLAIRNYCMYFFKTLYPVRLCPLYPFVYITPLDYLLIAGCIGILIFIGWKKPEKLKFDVLPMLFAAGMVLGPVSGIMTFNDTDFADRYSYVPSIFFLTAVTLAIPKLPEKFRAWRWSYPAALLLGTLLYKPVWNGDESLLREAVSRPGCNFHAAIYYSAYLQQIGEEDSMMKPLEQYDHTHPRAARFRIPLQHFEQGMRLLYRSRRGADPALLPEFMALLNQDSKRESIKVLNYIFLIPLMTAFADCALSGGKPDMAARIYDGLAEDCRENPFYRPFYHGVAAMLRKDPAAAVPYFEQAHRCNPGNETARLNLETARRKAAENAR